MPLPSPPLASFTWFDTMRKSEMPSMKMRWAPIWAAASMSRLSGERSSWLSTCGLVKMSFSWFCCCNPSRSQPKAKASRMIFLGATSKVTMIPGSWCSVIPR